MKWKKMNEIKKEWVKWRLNKWNDEIMNELNEKWMK